LANFVNWLKSHLPTQRRLIQLYAALLYNAHIKGFIQGDIYTGASKMLCVPGFNCYSCPGAIGACPLGALQNAVVASGNRAPTYVLGILMLYGLILGRTICGFLCPVGLLQELLHKLPTPKIRKGRITRALSWGKYVILAIFVFAIPLWYSFQAIPIPAFCKYICPAGIFEGAVPLLSHPGNADKLNMLGILFTRKFVIFLMLAVSCVFVFRSFCRFLCPLGAIYGLFAKIAIIGVKVDMAKCIDCGRCVSMCQMDIHCVGDHECIHCGECISICPTKAITFKAGKYVLHGPEINKNTASRPLKNPKRRLLAWGIAVGVLLGVLVSVNLPDQAQVSSDPSLTADINSGEIAVTDPNLVVGHEVGMLAPNFSLPVYDSDIPFTLSSYRGKKVIINFWATWCTPCCNELPYFDELYQRYGNEVAVIAIHSDLVTDDIAAYLGKYDYLMPFALDETGEIIKAYGGSTMLPQTIILDENGIVSYNAVGSLTLEKLKSLIGVSDSPATTMPSSVPGGELKNKFKN